MLAVGVSAYDQLPKLGFAAADALALGDAFRTQAGDEKLYRGADITLLTDADATLPRLRQASNTTFTDSSVVLSNPKDGLAPLGKKGDWLPYECAALARAQTLPHDARDKKFLAFLAANYCPR